MCWRFQLCHPVFDLAALKAQGDMAQLQGRQRTWFCGAWMGYGFHEDGLKPDWAWPGICWLKPPGWGRAVHEPGRHTADRLWPGAAHAAAARAPCLCLPTFFLMLPLRSMRRVGSAALAHNRPAWISFFDADHGDGRQR